MEEYSSIISNSNIINLISKIHEYKGKQSYLLDTKKDTLETLLKVAKIQSTSSSNKIEGIYTTDKRINEIVNQKLEPKNRNEEEIAGYRDVLTLIHENYNFIDINQNTILQLHRDLYKYTGYSYGGKFKNSQNFIEEENEKGEKKIRFTPLSPVETPIAIEELCKNYNELVNNESCDLLVLIPIFILDFVSIHPFNDGNGRMSRLLTLLLLYKVNYMVGKYISIEKIIEETKDSYYDALEKSSLNWHNNENDYSYFVDDNPTKFVSTDDVRAFSGFSSVSEEVAASTQEVTATIGEQVSVIDVLKDEVEALRADAKTLGESIDRFKV